MLVSTTIHVYIAILGTVLYTLRIFLRERERGERREREEREREEKPCRMK